MKYHIAKSWLHGRGFPPLGKFPMSGLQFSAMSVPIWEFGELRIHTWKLSIVKNTDIEMVMRNFFPLNISACRPQTSTEWNCWNPVDFNCVQTVYSLYNHKLSICSQGIHDIHDITTNKYRINLRCSQDLIQKKKKSISAQNVLILHATNCINHGLLVIM